MVNPAEFL
jgi:hypothetical protein